MSGISFAVEGVEAVIEALATSRLERITKHFLERAADLMYEQVMPRAPRRTGALADSVNRRITARQAKVGPDATNNGRPYPRFVEFGTVRGITGRHYMSNALAAAKPGIERLAEDAMREFGS